MELFKDALMRVVSLIKESSVVHGLIGTDDQTSDVFEIAIFAIHYIS